MPESSYDPARSLLVTAAQVRSLTGANSSSDVSDADLQEIIRRAQASVLREVASRIRDLELEGGADGSRTTFLIPRQRRDRVILDDTGDLATGSADVLVQLRDDDTDPPTWSTATVSSVDALNGTVTLSAAPGTDKRVFFDGRLTNRRLDKEDLVGCIMLLAAHYVAIRMEEAGRVNLANPNAQQREGTRARLYLIDYQREVRRLRGNRPQSATVDTRITGSSEAVRTDP